MNKKDKKFRRSGVAVACYVIAAAMLVYVCYQIGNTVSTINDYYSQYEINATAAEYVTYCAQAALQPFMYAITVFMLGYILEAVRKNNKANYMSDAEIEDAKIAKKEAKEAKKFAKGEAAAAKAGNVRPDEKSVGADFAKSLDEELKADEKKAHGSRQGGGQRKQGGSRKNSSYNNRANGGKDGANKDGAKDGAKDGSNKDNAGKDGGSRNNGGNARRRSSGRKPSQDKADAKADAKVEFKVETRPDPKPEVKVDFTDGPKSDSKAE